MELGDHDADAVEQRVDAVGRRDRSRARGCRGSGASRGSRRARDELAQVALLALDAALVVLEVRHRPLEAGRGTGRARRPSRGSCPDLPRSTRRRRRLRRVRRSRRLVLRGQASSNHCLILVNRPLGVSRAAAVAADFGELLEDRRLAVAQLLRNLHLHSYQQIAGRSARGRRGGPVRGAGGRRPAAIRRGPSARPCRRASGSRASRRARPA